MAATVNDIKKIKNRVMKKTVFSLILLIDVSLR